MQNDHGRRSSRSRISRVMDLMMRRNIVEHRRNVRWRQQRHQDGIGMAKQ
jgi:hypothetical protein